MLDARFRTPGQRRAAEALASRSVRLYLGLLTACLVVTLPLEMLLGARVYRRPRRLVLTLLPVVVVFCAWDILAIRAGHWMYDPRQTVGVLLPGRLPLEELLFFLVVPLCALLTFEAVRRLSGWQAGDE
jgi:lycopene cyclase domain-containing protein